jgi:alpha-L-arabinofuranosidase
VLVYESASIINEFPVSIDSKTVAKASQLSEQILDEFVSLKNYSQFPEYKQGSAIAITQNKVTKSISTRRYSEKLISLIEMIKDYIPTEYQPQLEKK